MSVPLVTALPTTELAAPQLYDPALIVTPEDNPVYGPAALADLMSSFPEHGQLVPGWISPLPDADGKYLCLDGNRRLAVCRLLGILFLAFNLGRHVKEAERIKLTLQYNFTRRVMGRGELIANADRYMTLTGASQAVTARALNISEPTLSRALGDRRIPAEFRERAECLGLSSRSLIASLASQTLMSEALTFAESPGPSGRKRTRDELAEFVRRLRKNGLSKERTPRPIRLKHNGRAITLEVKDQDTAVSVSEELKTLASRLAKLDVPPGAWHYHFI